LGTAEDLRTAFRNEYGVNLDDRLLDYLCRSLERYGFIQITSDSYAGDYITPLTGWGVSYRLNKIKTVSPENGLTYVLERGSNLLSRAFSNRTYWTDLDTEIDTSPEDKSNDPLVGDNLAPTSDGLVSLTHNQFKEIDEPTGQLLEQLEQDNGIPDHPGLKERLVGQIRAGREILRAGEFRLVIFKDTMLAGLRELAERYGDHAIGAAASTLLTLILHVLGLPGF
jgi:hypothetical protein